MAETDKQRQAEREYVPLLAELTRLIHAGRGDTDEADRVRDRMDAPEFAMSDAGRRRMAALSRELDGCHEHTSSSCCSGPAT